MTRAWSDDERIVDVDDEWVSGYVVDDRNPGGDPDDDRLRDERPPHWD